MPTLSAYTPLGYELPGELSKVTETPAPRTPLPVREAPRVVMRRRILPSMGDNEEVELGHFSS